MSVQFHRGGSSAIRIVVIAVLAFGAGHVWFGSGEVLPTASAQMLPNPAAERQQMLLEMRRTNQLLAELVEILRTETLQVRLDGTDKKVAPAPGGNVR